eukprot:TRINITY_DN42532_c0_g1_i1.p2 TRINITY_DN42532_c0_g1~~TRINITY_DN42532_c0_g1_i1.p2  ORF type:complete len:172 (+),score=58.56 TRINITY_DN42532_c0_g1_i1:70-516(+)
MAATASRGGRAAQWAPLGLRLTLWLVAAACAALGARLALDPVGHVRGMLHEEAFERFMSPLVEALTVWAGFLLMCLAALMAIVPCLSVGAGRCTLLGLAVLWLFDGIYIKCVVFQGTGVIKDEHAFHAGIVDCSIGIIMGYFGLRAFM